MSPAQPTPTLATDTHPNQHCRPQAEHCLVVIHDTHFNNIANITLDEWRPGRPGYLRETACAELLRLQTTIVERHPAPACPRPGQAQCQAAAGSLSVTRDLVTAAQWSSAAAGQGVSAPLFLCLLVAVGHFLRFYPFSVH